MNAIVGVVVEGGGGRHGGKAVLLVAAHEHEQADERMGKEDPEDEDEEDEDDAELSEEGCIGGGEGQNWDVERSEVSEGRLSCGDGKRKRGRRRRTGYED